MGGPFSYDTIIPIINNNYKIAIESGTFKGEGTMILSTHFDTVYTIEIDQALFHKAVDKFKNDKNINCLLGDSKEVISTLSQDPTIKNENIVFWLDAHWSGDSSVDWKHSQWKGPDVNTGYVGQKENGVVPGINQVPLEQEIYQIYTHFTNECVIYIDDFDKVDPITLKGYKNKCFVGEDYSHLDFNRIFNHIQDRITYKLITADQCVLKFKQIGA